MSRSNLCRASLLRTRLLLLLATPLGCDDARHADREPPPREHATEAPAVTRAAEEAPAFIAQFSDVVQLVGYEADHTELRAGDVLTITFHWLALRAVGGEWRTLIHVADGSGTPRYVLDTDDEVNTNHPPSTWQAGEHVDETVRFPLPADWDSDEARFHVGLWTPTREQLAVTAGRDDGNGHVVAARIPVRATPDRPETAGAPHPQ